jgi:predicted MPP superfamily phosphohydrolase
MTIANEIEKALLELSKIRPIFHSEADFQFALALKLKEQNFEIRLEKPYLLNNKRLRLDIEIHNKKFGKYAIELKYKTKKFSTTYNNEEFNLKSHYAQNDGVFLFWQDADRINKLIEKKQKLNFKGGFVIFLTNDNWYYESDEVGDKNITKLADHSSKKSCEDLLPLVENSKILWKNYSVIKEKTEFKFLMLEFPLKQF